MKKHKKDYLNKILWIGTLFFISYIVYICIGTNRSNLVYEKEEQKEREESYIEYTKYRTQLKQQMNTIKPDPTTTVEPDAIQAYTNSEQIIQRYQYAMYDTAGIRNDLSVDLLLLGDQLMTQFGLDPNLLFGIIMVESEGHADKTNVSSNARGLGQFMPDTGRFVYNKYIDKTTEYDHDTTPYNAEYNLRMTAYYLNYLYTICNGSTMEVLKVYCGGDDEFAQSYYYRVCNEVGYCIN